MLGAEFDLAGSDVRLNGIHIAEVISNEDPKALERIRVRVLGVHDMENKDPGNSVWAQHLAPSKSNSGEVPDPGDFVYVIFANTNDPMSVLWLGWVRTTG